MWSFHRRVGWRKRGGLTKGVRRGKNRGERWTRGLSRRKEEKKREIKEVLESWDDLFDFKPFCRSWIKRGFEERQRDEWEEK